MAFTFSYTHLSAEVPKRKHTYNSPRLAVFLYYAFAFKEIHFDPDKGLYRLVSLRCHVEIEYMLGVVKRSLKPNHMQ